MREDQCAICKHPIPPRKQSHQVCRDCIRDRGWNLSKFHYFPERTKAAK